MTEKVSESLPFEPPEQENIRLREENARLRRLLAVHSIPIPQLAPENRPPTKTVETAPPVDKEERARKRIALFRSLFRGREDVYARRWKNDDGRSGYVPAAVKDWKAINKSRPEQRKKIDQKTRKFLPLTEQCGRHVATWKNMAYQSRPRLSRNGTVGRGDQSFRKSVSSQSFKSGHQISETSVSPGSDAPYSSLNRLPGGSLNGPQ